MDILFSIVITIVVMSLVGLVLGGFFVLMGRVKGRGQTTYRRSRTFQR